MTKQEAISLLDRAVSQLQANRQDHVLMQQAIQLISTLVEPKPVVEDSESDGTKQ